MAAVAAPAQQKLRVLCFGDSLTAGFASWGLEFHPYRLKLQQMLEMAFPDLEIEVVEDGLSGDTVKHGFLSRMQRHFPPKRKPGESFDWTIVLGGTNDLAYSWRTEEIFEKLKETWDVPLRRKSKVLALTIPEVGVEVDRKRRDAKRDKLNDLIRNYKRDGFYVFDLNRAVPFFGMSEEDREKYWDDGVHFKPAGYDLVGKEVGMGLVKILEKDRERYTPPAKRRRVFRDDHKAFEEEDGDPTSLDQGYVVVRRKDLD
ncbi:hypothetical protein OQA88_5660 [Cercophora sp. LCS_1]